MQKEHRPTPSSRQDPLENAKREGDRDDVVAFRSPYLLPEQAADYLHVAVATLSTWRARGKGPRFRKHGRTPVYTLAALDEWSAQQERSAPETLDELTEVR